MIGQLVDDDDKIAALRARLRREFLDEEVLPVVQAHVDPLTYQMTRRELLSLI